MDAREQPKPKKKWFGLFQNLFFDGWGKNDSIHVDGSIKASGGENVNLKSGENKDVSMNGPNGNKLATTVAADGTTHVQQKGLL